MDDLGLGKRQVDEADVKEIHRHLVGNAGRLRCKRAQAPHIRLAEPAPGLGIELGNRVREVGFAPRFGADRAQAAFEVLAFPGSETAECDARICSISVVPDRGMPRTKIGTSERKPTPSTRSTTSRPKAAIMRSTIRIVSDAR